VQDPSSQVVPGLRYEGMLEIWSINGGLRYEHFCLTIGPHYSLLELSLWQYSSGKAHMTTLPWMSSCTDAYNVGAKTHPGGKVVSAVIILSSFRPPLLAWLEQHVLSVSYIASYIIHSLVSRLSHMQTKIWRKGESLGYFVTWETSRLIEHGKTKPQVS